VHPTTVQALAAERVRDWHQQAELARRVRQARRARRGRAEPAAGLPAAHGQALPVPDQVTAPDRSRVKNHVPLIRVPNQVPTGPRTADGQETEPYRTEPRQPAGARRA